MQVREGAVVTFGEQLRREREERGMTIETICETTKVSVKYLRSLEAGALEELPGGVFRRGIVRSYLDAVGLDEALWMQRFEKSCQQSGVKEPTPADWAVFAENVRNSRLVARRRKGLKWIIALVLLLALALAGWFHWRSELRRGMSHLRPIWRVLKSSVDNAPQR